MKLFYVVLIILFYSHCSFDSKTGIWNNEKQATLKEKKIFKDFKSISSSREQFNKEINFYKNYNFKENSLISNTDWKDVYYAENNNFKNFNYINQNKKIFKSKKVSAYKTSEHILFSDNNIITSDIKGNIIVFSVKENKKIFRYNFYKKNIEKIIRF